MCILTSPVEMHFNIEDTFRLLKAFNDMVDKKIIQTWEETQIKITIFKQEKSRDTRFIYKYKYVFFYKNICMYHTRTQQIEHQ